MYDPSPSQGPDGTYEYLELYNYGTQPIDLNGWSLSDGGSDTEKLTGFNQTTTLIPPEGYAVVTDEDSLVKIHFAAAHLSTGDSSICTSGLSNNGEPIRLFDQFGREIDYIAYSPTWGGRGNGKSLEKRIPEEENEEYNWGESSFDDGTPGERNSIHGVAESTTTTAQSTSTTASTTSTTTIERCSDGTILGECSKNKPYYCFDGMLVIRCTKCGCRRGFECVNDECVEQATAAPSNGTPQQPEKNPTQETQQTNKTKQQPKEPAVESKQQPAEHPSETSEKNQTKAADDRSPLAGNSILSKASSPKAAATITLSVLFGVYLLNRKSRQDRKQKPPGGLSLKKTG